MSDSVSKPENQTNERYFQNLVSLGPWRHHPLEGRDPAEGLSLPVVPCGQLQSWYHTEADRAVKFQRTLDTSPWWPQLLLDTAW